MEPETSNITLPSAYFVYSGQEIPENMVNSTLGSSTRDHLDPTSNARSFASPFQDNQSILFDSTLATGKSCNSSQESQPHLATDGIPSPATVLRGLPQEQADFKQLVEEEAADGWKFDPIENSSFESLCDPSIVNHDDYECARKAVSHLKAEARRAQTEEETKEDAQQHFPRQNNWESEDSLLPLDDASFNQLIDSFYNDQGSTESGAWPSLPEQQPFSTENSFGQDSAIHLDDGFASDVGEISKSPSDFPIKVPSGDVTSIETQSDSTSYPIRTNSPFILSSHYSDQTNDFNQPIMCPSFSNYNVQTPNTMVQKASKNNMGSHSVLQLADNVASPNLIDTNVNLNTIESVSSMHKSANDLGISTMRAESTGSLIQTNTGNVTLNDKHVAETEVQPTGGQTSIDSSDHSARACEQLHNDLQAHLYQATEDKSSQNMLSSVSHPSESDSSSDILSKASPLKIKSVSKKSPEISVSNMRVNLTPECDSDSYNTGGTYVSKPIYRGTASTIIDMNSNLDLLAPSAFSATAAPLVATQSQPDKNGEYSRPSGFHNDVSSTVRPLFRPETSCQNNSSIMAGSRSSFDKNIGFGLHSSEAVSPGLVPSSSIMAPYYNKKRALAMAEERFKVSQGSADDYSTVSGRLAKRLKMQEQMPGKDGSFAFERMK